MNLKARMGRTRRGRDDIEMTPIMNLFLILVPFLLVTAEFVNIAVLDMSLPQLNTNANVTQAPTELPKQSVLSTLEIDDAEMRLNSPTFNFPAIKKTGADYDYNLLKTQLTQIKQKFPEAVDMVIAPEDQIKYDIVIQVMDRCREQGFPNISISG